MTSEIRNPSKVLPCTKCGHRLQDHGVPGCAGDRTAYCGCDSYRPPGRGDLPLDAPAQCREGPSPEARDVPCEGTRSEQLRDLADNAWEAGMRATTPEGVRSQELQWTVLVAASHVAALLEEVRDELRIIRKEPAHVDAEAPPSCAICGHPHYLHTIGPWLGSCTIINCPCGAYRAPEPAA